MPELSTDPLKNLHAVRFPDLTREEFSIFVAGCQDRQISPFSTHVYPRRQWCASTDKTELRILLTIDGFRAVAIESGEFAGTVGPLYCGEDWEWHEVWRGEAEFPTAAKFGCFRKGCKDACFRVARWDEFAQFNEAGELENFWNRMPCHMLGLRAEALTLRATFPERLGGIYLPEELNDRPGPNRPRNTPTSMQPVLDLNEALIELGYEAPQERERITALYQSRWSLLAQNNPAEFAARVARAVGPKRRIVPVAE